MDTIKCMNAFLHVAELGSFSAAARALHTTQSNVSKQIAALEHHLGGTLLERGIRLLTLTPAAQAYLPAARAALEAVHQAQSRFGSRHEQVAGTVRIAASWAFGRAQIIPGLPELMELHPALAVDLRLSDQSVDLAQNGIDVAFRVAHLKDSSLVARRVGIASRLLVASPSYLQAHASPAHPGDLAQHECIYFSGIGAPRSWRFSRAREHVSVPVNGRFETDASEAVHEAVLQGLGIAALPAWMLQQDIKAGRLQALLSDWPLSPLPIYAVMLRSRRSEAANRTVVDFFERRFVQTFGTA